MANVIGCIGLISGNVLFADADCSTYRVLCAGAYGELWIYNADCDYGGNDGFYRVYVNSSGQLQVAMPETCCSHWYFLAGYSGGGTKGAVDAVNGVGHSSWGQPNLTYGECRGVAAGTSGRVAAVYAGGRVEVYYEDGSAYWNADHDDARKAVYYEAYTGKVFVANQNVRRYASDGSSSDVWTHGAVVNVLCGCNDGNVYVGGERTGNKSVWRLNSSFAEAASFDTGGNVYGLFNSIHNGNTLYVVGDRAGNKTLWALYADSLTEIWSMDTGADLRGVSETTTWIIACGAADGSGKTLFVIDDDLHTIHHSANTGSDPTRAVAGDPFTNVLAVSGSGLSYTLYDWNLSAQWTINVTSTVYALASRRY